MGDYNNLSELLDRIIHKYNQIEKIKRRYGSEVLVSRAEIHTIVVVGKTPDINITTLAKKLGITKGAASQMIYRLIDKDFVQKRISPYSDTEVCLTLTEQGITAYNMHKEYHETTNEHFFSLLQEMSEDSIKHLEYILQEFEKALDEKLKE